MIDETKVISPSCVSQISCTSSIVKSERDVAALQKHARFVIALSDTKGVELISNPQQQYGSRVVVPLIAIVVQVTDGPHSFWASVAEIGYGRTRPYRRVHVNRNKVLLQHRSVEWQLSNQQLQQVYPVLLQCFETILIDTRSRWKSDEPWYINGQHYEKGVQITVSHYDRALCQVLLHESIRYFDVGVFARWVSWINWKLRYSQFTSYPINLYGKNVRLVVDSVMSSVVVQNPFWYQVLMSSIGKRLLLENALYQMHGFYSGQTVETEIAFGQNPVELPKAEGLFFWHTLDQPLNKKGTHASNCSRFEVIFDRNNSNYRGEWDGKFYRPVMSKELENDPDYCPF